jgi:hypothetical protein
VSGSVWTQCDHERFLAAIAAAILGAQGSPVWARTASTATTVGGLIRFLETPESARARDA